MLFGVLFMSLPISIFAITFADSYFQNKEKALRHKRIKQIATAFLRLLALRHSRENSLRRAWNEWYDAAMTDSSPESRLVKEIVQPLIRNLGEEIRSNHREINNLREMVMDFANRRSATNVTLANRHD
jgi:hypothetical protein